MDDDHHQQQRATTGATVVSRTLGSGRGLVARIPQAEAPTHYSDTASAWPTHTLHLYQLDHFQRHPRKTIKCICAVTVAFSRSCARNRPLVFLRLSVCNVYFAAAMPFSYRFPRIAAQRIASHPPAAGAFPFPLTRRVT